jgi:hypothetical protein
MSDKIENERRAHFANIALHAYNATRQAISCGDEDEVVDLLTDLLHFARSKNFDAEALSARALANFNDEHQGVETEKPRVNIQFLLEITRPNIGFNSCFDVSPIASAIVNSGFLTEEQPIISVSRIITIEPITNPVKYSGVVFLVNVNVEQHDRGLELYKLMIPAAVDRGVRHNRDAIPPYEYKVSNVEEVYA